MTFIDFLVEKGILDRKSGEDVRKDVTESDSSLDKKLEERKIDPQEIIQAKSDFYGVPIKDLSNTNVSSEILKYIPEESATHYKMVPLAFNDGFLEVGMVDPSNLQARDALNFIASKNDISFKIFVISEKDFEKTIELYKGIGSEVKKALGELDTAFKEEDVLETKKSDDSEGEEGTRIIEDAPVTKIVATILRYAVEGLASDVHIEPLRSQVRVRFRVDGVMNTSLVLPINVHNAVVARIKILSRMKLDEKRKPQDGRFSARIEGRKIDFRVSTFPSYYGEKIVMRILDQKRGVKTIKDLGLSDKNMELLRDAIKRPYGLILISGPTGSGKSTTLYSVLNEIDSSKKNVLSLEDPVEYGIEGINQSQVFPEIGYTFANGLRTTLRQDPDVIMVGEIRDGETAKLAIQASLTGHLVLSTIHTNTSAGIIPRLIDMGVDPYLIPPTLVLGVAQRLVRKICEGGGEPMKIEGSIKEMFDKQFSDLPEEHRKQIPQGEEVLKIKATEDCPSGTKGRVAVFEMYKMDRDIEKVILQNPVESAVYDVARLKGMLTMKEDAIIKAIKKIIPWEEVNNL
ncbi:type II/IV secretion system protein [Candidatus Parcubacteria bacterium]|nr:type II/IV secretion system protein [Candidatus Parcubacteria bacterium]